MGTISWDFASLHPRLSHWGLSARSDRTLREIAYQYGNHLNWHPRRAGVSFGCRGFSGWRLRGKARRSRSYRPEQSKMGTISWDFASLHPRLSHWGLSARSDHTLRAIPYQCGNDLNLHPRRAGVSSGWGGFSEWRLRGKVGRSRSYRPEQLRMGTFSWDFASLHPRLSHWGLSARSDHTRRTIRSRRGKDSKLHPTPSTARIFIWRATSWVG